MLSNERVRCDRVEGRGPFDVAVASVVGSGWCLS